MKSTIYRQRLSTAVFDGVAQLENPTDGDLSVVKGLFRAIADNSGNAPDLEKERAIPFIGQRISFPDWLVH